MPSPADTRSRSGLRYDVEADWTLLLGCNYRCSYCFFSAEQLSQPIRALATHEQWRDAFDATDRTWLLHITGGEPTVYPDFVGLCEALTERHYLSINTNLSRDSVLALIGKVPPERVHYFHASFHPAERERKKGVDDFIRRASALRDAGFTMLLTAVATPEILADFNDIVAPLRQAGLPVAPKILRGRYRGRNFPRAYTTADKAHFRFVSIAARREYDAVVGGMVEPPTIDVSNDIAYLDGIPSFRGRNCDAGYRFVAIGPDGAVVRCGTSTRLGNVLDGTLRLFGEGRRCDSTHCMYFCEKYAAPAPAPKGLAAAVSALRASAERWF